MNRGLFITVCLLCGPVGIGFVRWVWNCFLNCSVFICFFNSNDLSEAFFMVGVGLDSISE